MYKLIKTLNKFNGNICFAGATDLGDVIFECDRQNRTVSYVASSKTISDVCLEREDSYLVAFSDDWLGQYSGGILNESYISTGTGSVDKITGNSSSGYFILNRSANCLYKFKWGTIWWVFNLPDYSSRHDGKIVFRESDGTVIYCNNSTIYIIRDSGASAVILNSVSIDGSGDLSAVVSNEFLATYSYMRARTVDGKELDQSSSSSFSFSSSSLSFLSSEASQSSASLSSISSGSSDSSDSSLSRSLSSRSSDSSLSSSTWIKTSSSSISLSSPSSSSSSQYDCNIAITSIVPNMTSDVLPSPYVVRSTFEDGQGVPEPCTPKMWKAFNNTYDVGTYTFDSVNYLFTYLAIDLGALSSAAVNHYKITVDQGSCTVVSPPCPLEWYLQGSNVASPVMTTDADWVNIHHVSVDITFWKPQRGSSYPLTRSAACFYNIGNVTVYRHYRLRMVRNEGLLSEPVDMPYTHVSIAQFDMAVTL